MWKTFAPLLLLSPILGALRAESEPLLGLPEEALEVLEAVPQDVVALGERLFFDPVLSLDRSVSCSSCHLPERGFADDRPLSLGLHGQATLRNTPTLYNRAFGKAFMWDGQAASLEEQVLLPIENELEMGLSLADAVARLAEDASYAEAFSAAFGGAPASELLAGALAAYVRSLVYAGSPVDEFRAGQHDALTPAERSGLWLFESRGGCWRCHDGPNFADEEFHNTGVGVVDGESEPGRAAISGSDADRGAFKTPTLRGLTETAPYMHDGSLATLEEVVEFYRRGGEANPQLDPLMKPVEMTDEDAANLVAFLRALSRRE